MKTMTELISWFQLEYPQLVDSMKNCNHHLIADDVPLSEEESLIAKWRGNPVNINPYHCESDVFTHTLLVCKQAENAPYEVQIAALLHDIGKPNTRAVNPKNGRVSFFNHDAVSAFKSLEILNREELGLNKEQKVRIFNMIALHTQIYKLTTDQLSQIGDINLLKSLIALGRADHSGRFHTKGEAIIPNVWDVPIKLKRLTNHLEKEVVILCGLPNGGKSTYRNNKDSFIVSRDDCLLAEAMMRDIKPYSESDYNKLWEKSNQKDIDRLLQERFKESKNHDKVIVDMTHMSKKSRKRSLSHFGSEYKKKCIVFLPDLPTLFERNNNRTGKVIDKSVINKMIRSFYPPSFEEFDEIEYVI